MKNQIILTLMLLLGISIANGANEKPSDPRPAGDYPSYPVPDWVTDWNK